MPSEIERLYREHRAGLVRLVERELHDQHEAEDVVQTAFLDAQRALERGTVPRNPRAWLATIALNTGRRLRRRRLNAEPLGDYAAQETSGTSEIRAALTGLPSEQREAVLYRDLLGLSYGETADQMGTSVNAVTMLLYRGRQRLRETLGVSSGGLGWWRWLKQSGTAQVAVAKGAAAVVVAAGLATGGAVAAGRAARAAAPVETETVAAAVAAKGSLAAAVVRTPGAPLHGAAPRHAKASDGATSNVAAASTQAVTGAATQVSAARPPTAPPTTSILRVPAVPLSALPSPTVTATVTVVTPITAATVTVPTVTAATVSTPLTTVTVPIP